MNERTHEPPQTGVEATPRNPWRLAWRWLIGLGVFAAMGVGADRLGELLADPTTLPLKRVRIEGTLAHLDRAELQRAVAGVASGGFFTVDVEKVWAAAKSLPWVQEASVRRVWPDEIWIRVTERVPVARWGSGGLVTAEGQVFRPSLATIPTGLNRLVGDDASAPELVKFYRAAAPRVARLGTTLTELRLDARGAWWLTLGDGVAIALGNAAFDERLERFVRLYPGLAKSPEGRLISVDLRYPHGLAVRRAPPVEPAAKPDAKPEAKPPRRGDRGQV
jgi:cell division protein FtsQ